MTAERLMTKERHAIVTGASEGLGRALARRLAADGWRVTGVARSEDRLRSLVDEIAAAGGRAAALAADLETDAGQERVAQRLREDRAQLFVNNAGFGWYGPFHQEDLARFDAMLRVNVTALVRLSHAYLREAQRGDALVNVSSAMAFLPIPYSAVYAGTKAFVTSFSEALWYEQRRRGVYVVGLCPGATATEFHRRASGSFSREPPKALMAAPDAVIADLMAALRRRSRPTVISGWPNKLGALLARLAGRKTTVTLMGKGSI